VLKRIKNLFNSFFKVPVVKKEVSKELNKRDRDIRTVQHAFKLDRLQYSPEAVGFPSQELQFSIYQEISSHINKDESIIDFGCGRGDFLAFRIGQIQSDVDYLGIDKNDELIVAGRTVYEGIHLQCMDWNDINIKKDCAINILSCNVNYDNISKLDTTQYLLKIIEKMMTVSKKGIVTFFEKSVVQDKFLEYDIKSLMSILTKDYNIVTDYIIKDMLLTLVITHK
jgi:SAM-dependent methyltransferase